MMRPGTRMLACALTLGGPMLGCRADQEACKELAAHVAELAQAEGRAGSGTAVALERDCNEQRPTQKLLECMMASETLAQLDEC
jgi:hypothetical protein